MKKKIICIVCPVGCEVVITVEKGEVSVKGNKCEKGLKFAKTEALSPVRILTTTVPVKNGEIKFLPIKTSKPLPRKVLMEAMKKLAYGEVEAPVKTGQVIIKDFLVENVKVVASRRVKRV